MGHNVIVRSHSEDDVAFNALTTLPRESIVNIVPFR